LHTYDAFALGLHVYCIFGCFQVLWMLLDFKKRRKRTKSQYICSITPSAKVLDRSPEPYQGKSLNHNPGEASSLVLHNREAK